MATLGKYELHEVLGKGGFGTVYRVTDQVLGRVVALKVLHPQWAVDPAFIERFQHEARLLAKLEHPNIVWISDAGEEGGRYYLVERYLPGGSLADRIQQGPLLVEDALRILNQVCAGLQELHKQGWVHRDLKPSNILFDASGQAVITDFGLARAMTGSGSSSSSSGTAGTPFYRAPELWRGKPPASPATDVYSLGCILGEMLTGKPLFAGDTPDEIITKHLVDGPDFGSPWPPEGVPVWLAQVVEKALQRDPTQRYLDAQSFAQALDGNRLEEEKRRKAKQHAPERNVVEEKAKQEAAERERKTAEEQASLDAFERARKVRQERNRLWIKLAQDVEMEFVRVPAGVFKMGAEQDYPHKFLYKVHLDEYWMGRYPVTNAQYALFVKSAGHRAPSHWEKGTVPVGKENHPVVEVNWEDAHAFCEWLSQESGQMVALPTEAQWEKAARGTDGRTYPWGDKKPDSTLCNLTSDTKSVDRYNPRGNSPYGCADMVGYKMEWCADWNDELYYYGKNPTGPKTGERRVMRGGIDYNFGKKVRAYRRSNDKPDVAQMSYGFRCSCSTQPFRTSGLWFFDLLKPHAK